MSDETELGTNVQGADDEVKATHTGGGWWKIEAPWLEAPEKVQGEDAAKQRVAELVAEAAANEDSGEEEIPVTPEGVDTREAPASYTRKLNRTQKKAVGLGKIPTKRIILEENDEIPPTGLYLGHNGRGYMILPGVEVDVPTFLIEILDNAVKAAPLVDPQTKQVVGWRNRMRYPYRVVS